MKEAALRFPSLVFVIAAAALLPITAHAATFTVTTNADSGPGSLRDAIAQANATPGRDEIRSAGLRVVKIALASPLPHIAEQLVVEGTFEINGTAAGAADGLVVDADDVRLADVAVQGFAGNGIVINGNRASLYEVDLGRSYYSNEWLGNGGDGLVLAGNDAVVEGVFTYGDRNGLVITGQRNGVYGFGGGFNFQQVPTRNRDAGIWVTQTARATVLGRFGFVPLFETPPMYDAIVTSGNLGPGLRIDGAGTQVLETWALKNGGDGIRALGEGTIIRSAMTSENQRSGLIVGLHAAVEHFGGGCNGGLLIDVLGDGPTPNDLPDVDGIVNAPRLTGATSDGTVAGSLDAEPNTTYVIAFVGKPDLVACGGAVESPVLVTTDANGFAQFRHGVTTLHAKEVLAFANRVDATGRVSGISEASAPVAVTEAPSDKADLAVRITARPPAVTPGQTFQVQFTVTNNGPATAQFDAGVGADGAQLLTGGVRSAAVAGETTTATATFIASGAAGTNVRLHAGVRLAWFATPTVDPNLSNNSAAIDIPIVQSVPTLSPLALALLAVAVVAFAVARIRA